MNNFWKYINASDQCRNYPVALSGVKNVKKSSIHPLDFYWYSPILPA